MKTYKLDEMVKGWLVGGFEPVVYKTEAVEVAIKRYAAGDYESTHYHKIACEITVITDGEAFMNGKRFVKDDIIVLAPFEKTARARPGRDAGQSRKKRPNRGMVV